VGRKEHRTVVGHARASRELTDRSTQIIAPAEEESTPPEIVARKRRRANPRELAEALQQFRESDVGRAIRATAGQAGGVVRDPKRR
jgi:hypothetical protein